MRWEVETWRKIYPRTDSAWLRMPLSARGLGSELLKYVDDAGRIEIGEDPPGLAIAYLCSARPAEHERIVEDVAALMSGASPYLVQDGPGGLRIRNFRPAQDRTPSAKRMAKMRANKLGGGVTKAVTKAVTPSVTSDVTVTRTVQSHPTSQPSVTVTSQSDGSRSVPFRAEGEEKPTPRQAWASALGHAVGMAVQVLDWPEEREALEAMASEAESKGVGLVELMAVSIIPWTRDPKSKLRAKGRGWRASDYLDWRSRRGIEIEPDEDDRRPPVFVPEPRGERVQPPDIAAALRNPTARPACRPSARTSP